MAGQSCRSLGPSQEPARPWWVPCQWTDENLLNWWYFWKHLKFWQTFVFSLVRKFLNSSIYECLVSIFRFLLVYNLDEVFWVIFLFERWGKCFWLLLHCRSPEFAHLLKECPALTLLTLTWINWCLKCCVCLIHWKKSNFWFFVIEIISFDFFFNPWFRDSLKERIYTKETAGTLGMLLTQEISSL